MQREGGEDLLVELSASRFSVGFSVFFFAFGTAAGFLLAFAGFGFLEESAGVIAGVFLVSLIVLAAIGLALFLLRHTILQKIFGVAQAQMELFSKPLIGIAEGAAAGDREQAVQSARRLVQLGLARYAWIATRRWIMTSLTALIAAMAALAGTALLFKQNALLGEQNLLFADQASLLGEQNERLRQQSALLQQQNDLISREIELSEAARNAALVGEVTQIAALLGAVADEALQRHGANGTPPDGETPPIIPQLDVAADLPRSLIFRIIAASQAMRPYRFLELGVGRGDQHLALIMAMVRRRDDLPESFARMAASAGWQDATGPVGLVDRPASPERGQLLRAMLLNGVRQFGLLNELGLDLSFSHAHGIALTSVEMRGAQLDYVDFTGGVVVEADFGGSVMNNARFRGVQWLRTNLAPPAGGEAGVDGVAHIYDSVPTQINGIDLGQSLIVDSSFERAVAMAADFDASLIDRVNFSGAQLAAATFRGAVLVEPVLDGADLVAVDLDGAYLFGEAPLEQIAAVVAPGSFNPERFVLEPATHEEALAAVVWYLYTAEELAERLGHAPAWRVVRVSAFE